MTNRVMSITSDDQGNVAAEVVISGTQAKPFGVIGCQRLHYDLPHVFLFRVGNEGLIEEATACPLGYGRLAAPAWMARGLD